MIPQWFRNSWLLHPRKTEKFAHPHMRQTIALPTYGRIALTVVAALVATLLTGGVVRSQVCGGAPLKSDVTVLLCPDRTNEFVEASAERDAEAALDPWRPRQFMAALRRRPDQGAPHGLMQSAAFKGNNEAIRLMLRSGIAVDTLDDGYEPRTALSAAAGQGDVETVRLLLAEGADVDGNQAREPATAPLTAAASWGHLDVVRMLLQAGADPDGGLSSKAKRERRSRPMEIVMISQENDTPLYGNMTFCGGSRMLDPVAVDCRRVAVDLVQAGATINGGERVNEIVYRLEGEPRWKAASILLAAAARNGRWADMIARFHESTDPIWIRAGLTRPNPNANFKSYISEVEACGPGSMRSRDDHFTFC